MKQIVIRDCPGKDYHIRICLLTIKGKTGDLLLLLNCKYNLTLDNSDFDPEPELNLDFTAMKSKIITVLIVCFLIFPMVNAQNLSVGGFIGGGTVGGFSAATGAFTSSIFAELNTPVFGFNTRLSFIYGQDFNVLLPGSTNLYFPFLKGVSLKAIFTQPLNSPFFLEEGFGPVVIDDRTYSNVDEWNYGTAFSMTAGIDFRKYKSDGFKLGLGAEYSITFGNTFAKYFSFHLQGQYYL